MLDLSKVAIHFSTYVHPICDGKCRESFEEMKNMVAK